MQRDIAKNRPALGDDLFSPEGLARMGGRSKIAGNGLDSLLFAGPKATTMKTRSERAPGTSDRSCQTPRAGAVNSARWINLLGEILILILRDKIDSPRSLM
jgi:hypothetical protein